VHGHGTDVYVYLQRLSTMAQENLPIFNAVSSAKLTNTATQVSHRWRRGLLMSSFLDFQPFFLVPVLLLRLAFLLTFYMCFILPIILRICAFDCRTGSCTSGCHCSKPKSRLTLIAVTYSHLLFSFFPSASMFIKYRYFVLLNICVQFSFCCVCLVV
jgi:hypothetical protein